MTEVSAVDRPRIVVLGATGMSGLAIIRTLSERAVPTRVVVHTSEGTERALSVGATDVAEADFADPSALEAAMRGADAALMIPPSMHPEECGFANNVFRAAETIGVSRMAYISVLHPHTPAMAHHMRKADAEAALRDSALKYTILQPSMYAQAAYASFCGGAVGVVRVPFDIDNLFSLIDLDDLAAVAVKVLTEPGHDYATYELAGPVTSIREAVLTAGRVRNVSLTPVRIAPADAPLPPRFAADQAQSATLRAMFENYDQHGLLGNSNVLQTLLGREPTTFEAVVRAIQA